MKKRNEYYAGLFQPWEIAVAVNVVAEYRRQWVCLEKEDFDDLLHESLSRWLYAKTKYNPKTGVPPRAFMSKVVRNHLANVVRSLLRKKRRILTEADYLDRPLCDGSDLTVLDKAADEHSSDTIHIEVDLKLDLARALRKLTPRQRELCRLLGNTGANMKGASAALNTPRATLYGDIERIRSVFGEAELHEYLHRQKHPDTSRKHGVSMSGGDHD